MNSWYRIIEHGLKKGVEVKEYFHGKYGEEFKFSTGEIEMELTQKHLKDFDSDPAGFIRKILEQDGRSVNNIKISCPVEESLEKRAFATEARFCCKCTWVHIDEPEEHHSTWICIKLPSSFLTPIGW